jgi:hypothetical protein
MPPRRFTATLGIGSLLALSAACADYGSSLKPCGTDLALSVSAGSQPTFRWTPACQVEALTVALDGRDVIVWGAVSPNQTNTIGSPVPYGTTPPGAAATANRIDPLVPGTSYQVTLFRVDDGGMIRAVGVATFVHR